MAFKLYSTDDGHVPAWEYLTADTITPKVGMALYESAGKLTTAAGSDVATYISMVEKTAACAEGETIPVVRIQNDQIWEAPFAADSSLAIGATTDIASGGLTVAAAGTAAANVEVVAFPQTTKVAGDLVRVRFVPATPAEA